MTNLLVETHLNERDEEIDRLRSPEVLAMLKTAQPQRSQQTDYVGEDGLTAREINAALQEFSDRLHEYCHTEEGAKACEIGWDTYWYVRSPFENALDELFNQ